MFEMFAADGTGKADFALESAGGTVVSTRCTRTYTNFKSAISLFGVTLAYWSRSPKLVSSSLIRLTTKVVCKARDIGKFIKSPNSKAHCDFYTGIQ